MAVWNPPQPVWKRNLAGILDFVLAFFGFGYLLAGAGLGTTLPHGGINFRFGPFALLVLLTVAYFVVLGRTGGTVFQRLFGMKRGKASNEDDAIARQF